MIHNVKQCPCDT